MNQRMTLQREHRETPLVRAGVSRAPIALCGACVITDCLETEHGEHTTKVYHTHRGIYRAYSIRLKGSRQIENKQTDRVYKCARCGHEVTQRTNHKGETYGLGHYNTCPKCPPWAKYPEFGGSQRWVYVREAGQCA